MSDIIREIVQRFGNWLDGSSFDKRSAVFDLYSMPCESGNIVSISERSLASRWGWNKSAVHRFLTKLEKSGIIGFEPQGEPQSEPHKTRRIALILLGFSAVDNGEMNHKVNHETNHSRTRGIDYLYSNNIYNNQNKDTLQGNNEKEETIIKDKSLIIKEESTGRKIFQPPTEKMVAEYCNQRQNGIDPQEFVDFYQSRGWMIGKNKMKDWKAAVRTWENRRRVSGKKSTSYGFESF